MNVIAQAGLAPDGELARLGVPPIWDFTEGEQNRKVVELVVGQQEFGTPYILPPGTPDHLVDAFRQAFEATMHDAAFLADATKAG